MVRITPGGESRLSPLPLPKVLKVPIFKGFLCQYYRSIDLEPTSRRLDKPELQTQSVETGRDPIDVVEDGHVAYRGNRGRVMVRAFYCKRERRSSTFVTSVPSIFQRDPQWDSAERERLQNTKYNYISVESCCFIIQKVIIIITC